MPKNKVSYFYKPDTASHYYGPGHPMKPHRLRLTHHLLLTYGLYQNLDVFRPHPATTLELEQFHSHDYILFLSQLNLNPTAVLPIINTNSNFNNFNNLCAKYNVGPQSDCPLFEDLLPFMQACAGASLDCAALINGERGGGISGNGSQVCINWSGGLHHAKKGEASGFCYVNDIVLCIIELLKVHSRVLYVDIDIHHGDGVEEAFYATDRVMTVSFHKYGEFFPGSGDVNEIGVKQGKGYSVNVPLRDGLTDETFLRIYQRVMTKVFEVYQPEVAVMCCGADSLSGDRLGVWNLSIKGHAAAVRFVRDKGIPVVVLGGGGYTPKNVARCWAYETGLLLGKEDSMQDDVEIPPNYYLHSFGPNFKLHVETDPEMKDCNDDVYLDKCASLILQQLSRIPAAPSVQFSERQSNLVDLDKYNARIEELEDKKYRTAEEERLLTELKAERTVATNAEDQINVETDDKGNAKRSKAKKGKMEVEASPAKKAKI